MHRFEELYGACLEDELLAESVAGELIDTEIEIRSGRGGDLRRGGRAPARAPRAACSRSPSGSGSALAAMGTHPWANYLDQRIIDTEHYNRLREELRWVAQRNNTWSLHVHVGIRGADRAIAVCDHLRGLLPPLLALSANSPFLDGHDTGLHSVRTRDLHPHLPALRRPRAVRRLGDLRRLHRPADARPGAIVESTQLWWSVRPHHAFGTVELRICDAQTRGDEAFGLAGADHRLHRPVGARLRRRAAAASRCASARSRRTSGRRSATGSTAPRSTSPRREVIETRAALERLVEWTAPAREALGLDVELPGENGAQRAAAGARGGRAARRRLPRGGRRDRRTLSARLNG